MSETGLYLNEVAKIKENQDIQPKSISSLFDPVLTPHEVSLNRKYDGGGGKTSEDRTKDFVVLHGKIREKHSSGSDKRIYKDEEDWDKATANIRKEEISRLFIDDGLDELEIDSTVSEQLLEDDLKENLQDYNHNWKEDLKKFGKTLEDNDVNNENVSHITPITREDRRETRYKYPKR